MAALQAGGSIDDLNNFDSGRAPLSEYCVMENLMRISPGCCSVLEKSGVGIERIPTIGFRPEPGEVIEFVFDWIFKSVEAEVLTPTARRVLQKGSLNETDLLVSDLEASLAGQEPNSFGGQVLEALGLVAPEFVRGRDGGWENVDSRLAAVVGAVNSVLIADPSHSSIQFVLYQDDSKFFRLRAFGASELNLLADFNHVRNQGAILFRDGLVQPIDSVVPGVSSTAIEELESLINTEAAAERDFQLFFERYRLLLTGLDFKTAHVQPILYKDDGSKLIPDFFLEKMIGGWDAIVDLKRPYDDLVV